MRGIWARRMRDLLDLHIADLGGEDAVSEAARSIVGRASVLEVELERLEVRFSEQPADANQLDLYARVAGNLRRLFEAVGLERSEEVQRCDSFVAALAQMTHVLSTTGLETQLRDKETQRRKAMDDRDNAIRWSDVSRSTYATESIKKYDEEMADLQNKTNAIRLKGISLLDSVQENCGRRPK